ncbi:hypothetical protein BDR26DRAFT_876141 [Obelidium mucronatum]|nr:hypothetical protein BDR26DRAFT_876141 [Obelidium mucronatum]
MSHFTDYQVRRFRFIFNQYSEGATTYASVQQKTVDPFQDPINGSTNTLLHRDDQSWSIKINFRLTAKEFCELLPRFGPAITLLQARDFIYEYDSSCTGSLDFDDFMEFLGDYQAILQVRRDKATAYYLGRLNNAQKPNMEGGPIWNIEDPIPHDDPKVLIARLFIQKYPEPVHYLSTLSLDDPEFFFTKSESVTIDIAEKGFIEDMNILKRSIVVRIYSARNLLSLTRLKKRPKKGIEFDSLDPMIRVELAGIVQQTPAIISTIKPDWNQDLKFEITIPPGEIHDVQQWVDRQVMYISLVDFDGNGTTQNTEVLAACSIPLLKILTSVKKPMWQVVRLNPLDCVLPSSWLPCLELSISDNTREQWAWAKIMDAYTIPEEVWFHNHKEKLLNDLDRVARSQTELTIDLWRRYCTTTRPLRTPFRRRTFHTFILNELNQIVPLTTLIRPIFITNSTVSMESPQDVAREISRIPYYTAIVTRSKKTEILISKHLSDAQEECLDRADRTLDGQSVVGWISQHNWTLSATQNFFAQVASPQTMLLQRKGTLLEHAMLLCNMLLGMGMPSYVAIGQAKKRPYVWVISILKSDHEAYIEAEEFDDFSPCEITYSNVEPPLQFQRTEFRQVLEASRRQTNNIDVQVIHWDPVTGANYTKSHQPNFGFERIETVFDNTNIFYNIQKSNNLKRPFFSWDLGNLKHWIPFFPEDLTPTSPINCFYSANSIIPANPPSKATLEADNRSLLLNLAQDIQLYRRHALFIPKTCFHRAASKFLQIHLNRFELRLSDMLMENMLWTNSCKGVGMASLSRRGSNMSASQTLLVDITDVHNHSPGTETMGLLNTLYQEMSRFTPDRCCFRLMVLHFKDANIDAIMDHLVNLGLLNATYPEISFVIGARLFKHVFATSIWIGIGYFFDLIGNEVHQLPKPGES